MSKDVGIAHEKEKADMQWPEDFLESGGQSIYGNALFRNLGHDKFVELSDDLGLENYWPWGPSTGDLNADGYENVFITASMNYPFRYGVNSVMLNNRGESFLDSEFILGIEPRRDGRAAKASFALSVEQAKEHRFVQQAWEAGFSPEHVVVWDTVIRNL